MEQLAEANQRTRPSPCLGEVQFSDVVAEQRVHDSFQTVSVSQHAGPDLLLRVLTEGQWKEILRFTMELGKQFEQQCLAFMLHSNIFTHHGICPI